MKIRKSYIQSYAICPSQFKKVYVLKLPGSEVRNPKAMLGKSFHGFANVFFDKMVWGELIELRTISDIKTYMYSKFESDIAVAMDELKLLMTNFVSFEANHFLNVREKGEKYFFPLEREFLIETKTLRGTIDRLDLLDNGFVCPMEYKVSESWKGTRWKTYLRRELAFYCVLLNTTEKYWKKGAYISAYNPLMDLFFFEQVKKQTLRALTRWVLKLNEAFKKDDFPKKISGLCMYCFDKEDCLSEEEMPEELEDIPFID